MSSPLNILQLEDDESDASLVLRVLRKAGLDVYSERVQDAAAMRAALAERTWDAIISDYKMPEFNAPAAFAILKELDLDVPFIVVSGTIGEDRAVAMMKVGVHDYLMKDRLERLAPAVEREINEARNRGNQREASRALLESEERFRFLFQSDVVGIFVADKERVLEANPYFLRLFGYSSQDIAATGILWSQLTPPRADKTLEDSLGVLLETKSSPAQERFWRRRDGKQIEVLVGGVRLWSASRPQLLGFAVDLTERTRLQNQLLQSQKLEGLGRLAGGVAHDFNNLLTVIIGYSAMLLDDQDIPESWRDSIGGIAEAAGRATTLTRQLLAFSRNQVNEPKHIVLNEIIADFRKMLERLIGEDVQLEVSLSPEAGVIRADPAHIEQLIMNLAVNARDAMPANGTLRIETSKVTVDEKTSKTVFDAPVGQYVLLTVHDTGTGIPPEIISQIFEPFFTTKEKGKGTGLGLSMVYGIVKQSGGSIWVTSEPHQGTTFNILFPVAIGSADAATPGATPGRPSAGNETLLLVEDDESVRSFIRKTLEPRGYRILSASNGKAAIELARACSGAIHLVLTDAVMPEMGGEELAESLAALLPGVPFVCMSGYVDRAWRRKDWAAEYICKPFSPAILLALVRKVLDSE